jgi:hypothetical protein
MNFQKNRFWIILLIISISLTIYSLFSMTSLREDISGDGIPNRPQKGPPIEFSWGQAIQSIIIAIVSISISVISWKQIKTSMNN